MKLFLFLFYGAVAAFWFVSFGMGWQIPLWVNLVFAVANTVNAFLSLVKDD